MQVSCSRRVLMVLLIDRFSKMQVSCSRRVLMVLLILSFFQVFSQSFAEPEGGSCSAADRAALLSFKASIRKDTTEILASWRGGECCGGDWEGVECNPQGTGRVVALQLQRPVSERGLYMKGTLSSSLGRLEFLEALVISGMKQITGPIPETISTLTHLTQLVLEDNSLQGTIPPSLGHLSLLNVISISGNRFQGPIPPSLGNLKNLLQLNLPRNSFSGPFPSSFKNLLNLQYLDLSFNLISGSIPNFIGNYKNLTFFDLSNNKLSGKIPISVCNLPNLRDLSLSMNQLSGSIPDQIGRLRSLTTLSLSSNQLTGQVPASLSRLNNLWSLNLSRNGLSNPLPGALAKGMPSLLTIDLSYNSLSLTTVPDWIRNRHLSEVHLAGCRLKGTLPRFGRPHPLTSIDLSDNQFTDGLGSFFTNMTSLLKLKLSTNKITGSLGMILNDKINRFLEEIDVSNNQISGTIPELREGLGLKVLNIARNNIGGHIPTSISSLTNLEKLDFSRNQIAGTIPTSLGLLENLLWLDLSINKLIGKIPSSMLDLHRLKHANFRVNSLCGEIPQGRPYNIFPPSAYAHNLCLCSKPLPPCRGRTQSEDGSVKS